ncbi:MAG: 5'-nucleotidase C-terminal domain-containing protein, partial [Gammaproteobacteria bacterium]|nr:5'-nucleotidase C-terminal domain-containing protein [Gammaproteobacteria bacterium]
MNKLLLVGMSSVVFGSVWVSPPLYAGDDQITLIHTGDFHGHLVARPNMRSDGTGKKEGGLARIAAQIKKIRASTPNSLLLHTGDTIQGSAEVMYTRGQAIVDIVNDFGIDAFAPGNWEFVYGTSRFVELFADPNPKAPWNAVAANVLYNFDGGTAAVLPPYLIKQVGNLKVGILGMTTDRGPQVVGSSVTKSLMFLRTAKQDGEDMSPVDKTVQKHVKYLRTVEKVDLLVMLSELGLANNLRIAESIPGIDVVLSSDMHEESQVAIVAKNKDGGETLVVEEGQDGTIMGELKLSVAGGKIAKWEWIAHNITADMPEDPAIAAKVAAARKTFLAGPDFKQHVNPFNGSKLLRPIDSVVGQTKIALHRTNFSNENMPAVIEGSAHDFLTDAFRSVTGAQIGAIRGFRYGTHIAPGPITMEDLYHFMPIGPQIATAKISGKQLKEQIEGAADGSLNPDVSKWTGGWLFNFSGVTMDIDPYQEKGKRASNIKVDGDVLTSDELPRYTYASYWYKADPCKINVVDILDCTNTAAKPEDPPVPSNVTVYKNKDGTPMDGTEVVVKYLES